MEVINNLINEFSMALTSQLEVRRKSHWWGEQPGEVAVPDVPKEENSSKSCLAFNLRNPLPVQAENWPWQGCPTVTPSCVCPGLGWHMAPRPWQLCSSSAVALGVCPRAWAMGTELWQGSHGVLKVLVLFNLRSSFHKPPFCDSSSLMQTQMWKYVGFVDVGLPQSQRGGSHLVKGVFKIYSIINKQ